MAFWLMKTEPSVFAFGDFLKHPLRLSSWEGIRNYQARNFMRDQFKLGDLAAIYHSSCETPGVVGVAEVVRSAYPDPTALDPKSPYYDPKSHREQKSRWVMVDLVAVASFAHPLSLKEIKETPALATMLVIKPGQRLSIQPVSPQEWEILMSLGRPQSVIPGEEAFARDSRIAMPARASSVLPCDKTPAVRETCCD